MEIERHTKKKKQIKDKNCQRSERIVTKNRKQNVFNAWKNVVKWMKNAKFAKSCLEDGFGDYLIKRSLKKWRARCDKTKLSRDRFMKLRFFSG